MTISPTRQLEIARECGLSIGKYGLGESSMDAFNELCNRIEAEIIASLIPVGFANRCQSTGIVGRPFSTADDAIKQQAFLENGGGASWEMVPVYIRPDLYRLPDEVKK